jgi:enolase
MRGHPAVEAVVETENGGIGVVQCTAGISIGTHEIAFTYDGGSLWRGKGVQNAVGNVNDIIAPAIIGMDAAKQWEVDHSLLNLCGSGAKGRLGGNAVAAVSAAVLKAGAESLNIPLYRHIGGARAVTLPCAAYGCAAGSNRYGGGLGAGSKPTYSFVAYDFFTFSEAQHALWEVWNSWQGHMTDKYCLRPANVSENYTSGGFISILPGIFQSDMELWQLLAETICRHGFEGRVGLQVDVASDSFYNKQTGTYDGLFSQGSKSREEMIELIVEMASKYPFVIIEDPLNEDDYDGHAELTRRTDIQIVGDDLFATNARRVEEGVRRNAANTVLLKVNQIGSISESLEMIQLAYENGYGVMPCSSRGESIDICDYSVGINAGTIRESCLGAPGNRFLQIERELGSWARFAGSQGIKGARFGTRHRMGER